VAEESVTDAGFAHISNVTSPDEAMSEIARVTRSKQEARETYDRLSRYFDLVEAPFERRFRQAGLRLLGARAGERVLEIGFGTGQALVDLARSVGPSGMVAGVDLSPGMRKVAMRRLRAAGLERRVDPTLADAAALPFDASSFDALFMSFTLELFDTPEIPVVLRECRRVLNEDGRMVVVAMATSDRSGPTVRVYLWGHDRLPRLLDCRPIPIDRMLAAAGFLVDRSIRMSMLGVKVEAVRCRNERPAA
jgi:ubiquinone/menaquinone biosynthesis C-methylase UbiE